MAISQQPPLIKRQCLQVMVANTVPMQPLFPFEVTPSDFFGGDDLTDHRIVWVLATTREHVETALAGTGALVSDLPEDTKGSGAIDATLPDDSEALRRFVSDPKAKQIAALLTDAKTAI